MKHRRTLLTILLIIAPTLIGTALTCWSVRRERIERGPYRTIELETLSIITLNEQSGTEADIPQVVRNLDGSQVSVTGMMWGLTFSLRRPQFQLVARYSFNEHRPPTVQDRIFVQGASGSHIDFMDGIVRVRGILHIRIQRDENGTIRSLYTITDPIIDLAPPAVGVPPRSALTAALGWGVLVSVVFALAVITPSALQRLQEWFHQRRMRRAGFCRRCGYDLRASIIRCPECGTPFTAPWRPEISARFARRDQARQL